MGCFQLESPAMRGLLKKMQIQNVNDVIAAVALIRPGAAGSGMKDVYIRRRAGLEKITYVHPSLAPALDDTYGVIIYQEQVLQVAPFCSRTFTWPGRYIASGNDKIPNKKRIYVNLQSVY